ncbi:8138_t:CDS:10, partial [Racocetra persica]
MDLNPPAFFRFSDLLRKSHSQSKSESKGKGKAIAVDFTTNLLENIHQAQEELKYNLSQFKQILQQNQNIQWQQQASDDNHKANEYGSDLFFNDLPTSYFYDDFHDNDETQDFSLDGIHDQYEDESVSLNREWFLKQCESHISTFGDVGGAITPIKLCTNIFTVLRSKQDDIETELVDLLGYENLNFVTTLVTNRFEIVENIRMNSDFDENQMDSFEKSDLPLDSIPTEPKRPQFGSQITVQFADDVKKMKRLKKEHKKAMKNRSAEDEESLSAKILGFDSDKLREIREHELRSANDLPPLPQRKTLSESFKHVFGKTQPGSVLSVFGTKYSLPAGTKQHSFTDHEEIIIPITQQAPQLKNQKLIIIGEMDYLCKGSFKGYKSLNCVQSIVYPVAYKKNDNMLICAPTGAGKTDVAMLAILRILYQYCDPNPSTISENQKFTIRKNEFKVVYIAPMKALVAEIVKKLGKRLEWLGIQVRELTGDIQLTKAEISSTQIIVTTPEKWDVVTRKSTGDTELSKKVKLLIIDEVHLLHDDRGAVLESLVARTRRQVESSQSMIRIIGLSATLHNYVDVARFLGVNLSNGAEGLFYFDGGFRPVPLEQHFIGVKGKPGSATSNTNLNHVLDLVKKGHQVMVFVHARKETVKTAQLLREYAIKEGQD